MKNFVRVFFILILLFEAMGMAGVFHFASDFTWFGLMVTAGFAWSMIEVFHFSPFVWMLALLAIILDAASALLLLYSRIPPWDRYVHTWCGMLIAAAGIELAIRMLEKEHIKVRNHAAFMAASTFLIVAGVGFLYEFLEYLVDRFQYGYPKSLVSAYNSIEDQLFNLLGAAIALTAYFVLRRRKNMRGETDRDQ